MRKLLGAALLILGVLMLVYRGFSYTKKTHEARIGGFGVQLKQRERLEVPVWAGAIVTLAGGALLASGAMPGRRKG
jgi:drug/metabolite transporter (DMT)-like permease